MQGKEILDVFQYSMTIAESNDTVMPLYAHPFLKLKEQAAHQQFSQPR